MILGQPWTLALAALAVPIVLVYLLRGNPRRLRTTTTFLWRGLDQPTTARRNWRRPPRSLALLLQLLALLAGVLALAQPAAGESSSRQLVILLDASPSMQATDASPSRFEAARQLVRTELSRLQSSDRVTLIRLGSRPELLANGSADEVRPALERARPGLVLANLRDGLALAGQLVQPPATEGSEIVVYTDGALADPVGLGPLPLPVRFVTVGTSSENQGISLLQVRRVPGEAARLAGFARVTNYSDNAARVPVRLSSDGLALDTRLLELPPRGRVEVPFDVPAGARTVSAQLGGRDQLSLDDRADVTIPENRRRTALLVSRSPSAWQAALGVLPGLELTTQLPGNYRDIGAEFVVLDGYLPPKLPAGQLLLVNPPGGNPLVDVLGDVRDVQISSFDAQSPLLRSLDLGAIRLVRASRLAVPRWARSVAETPSGPLILQGEQEGRRIVVLGFDPLVSGLEKLVSFPILTANVVEYLDGAGTDPFVAPGQIVTLPIAPDAREIVLERPDGTRQTVAPKHGAVQLDPFDRVGRYSLLQALGSGAVQTRTFFVQLAGETEADIKPRQVAPIAALAALEPATARPGEPFWFPLAALALALLGLEWVHYVRRG